MPITRPSGPPRTFFLVLLVVSLVFVAGGVAMIVTGIDGGTTATLFFGVCAAVFVLRLRPDLLETEQRSLATLVAQYPGPLVLRAPARKNLVFAAGSAIFGGVLLEMLREDAISGVAQVLVWPGVVLFLGGAPLLVAIALRGSSLHLDAEGMSIAQIRRSRHMPWRDLDGFDVARMPGAARMVVFDDASIDGSAVAAMNRKLVGRTSGLPDTYGLSAEDLAVLLTTWGTQARSQNRSGIDPR